jgi:L-amino acid N-acyltransferase YncA
MAAESSRVIRDATGADASVLLEIYAPSIRETAISFEFEVPTVDEFAARIEKVLETGLWILLELDGAVAGYAYATEFRGRAAYAATRETTVYVSADHHRQGVGQALLEALLGRLTERGARLAIAGITLPNAGSVALHEALGFRHVGVFHEVGRKFDEWQDVGFWELPLGG